MATAIAQASIAKEAAIKGVVRAKLGQTVDLSGEDTSGWTSQLWEILDYPEGWTAPEGWALDEATGHLSSSAIRPPTFNVVSTGAGKWPIRLTVNGSLVDETLLIEVVTNMGLHATAFREGQRVGGKAMWARDLNRNWAILEREVTRGVHYSGAGRAPKITAPDATRTALAALVADKSGSYWGIPSSVADLPPLDLWISSFAEDTSLDIEVPFWGLDGKSNWLMAEAWAPGGGGTTNIGGAGGGAYARRNAFDATGATNLTISGVAISDGKSQSTALANANGSDATITAGGTTVVMAKGGSLGSSGKGGVAAACVGDVAYSGGDGESGSGSRRGGAGAGSRGSASGQLPGPPDGGSGGFDTRAYCGTGGRSVGAGSSLPGWPGRAQVYRYHQAAGGFPALRASTRHRFESAFARIAVPQGFRSEASDVIVALVAANATGIEIEGWHSLGTAAQDDTRLAAFYFSGAVFSADVTIEGYPVSAGFGPSLSCIFYRFHRAALPEATFHNGSGADPSLPSHTSSTGTVNGVWIAAAAWMTGETFGRPILSPPVSAFEGAGATRNWQLVAEANVGGSVGLTAATCTVGGSASSGFVSGFSNPLTIKWATATILVPGVEIPDWGSL